MGSYFPLRAPSQLSGKGSDGRRRRIYRPGANSLPFPAPFSRLLSDRYHILKLLGQGGFGRTFLATDRQASSSSLCVIKQLFLPSSGEHRLKALQLFYQEAQRLAELGEHPQIPKLLNTFAQDEQIFIVQEWIDGWTLEQEVAGTPFDEVEIWNVLRELLPVLQYLHERQIIHRDIKPANIIRRRSPPITAASPNQNGKQGNLILVDFGAAKHLGDAIHTETLIGSAEYAAPEQTRGHAVFASDLYSLGVTCLHLLTQTSPFDLYDMGDDAWKWQAYLAQPISPSLKHILSKLLHPATRRRYGSAAEVLADLDALSTLPAHSPVRASAWASARIEHATKDASASNLVLGSPLTTAVPPPVKLNPALSIANAILKPISFGQRFSKAVTKDAVDLVFSLMFLLILTCIGSMALICVVFEIEQRSPALQPEIQQFPSSSDTPTPDRGQINL